MGGSQIGGDETSSRWTRWKGWLVVARDVADWRRLATRTIMSGGDADEKRRATIHKARPRGRTEARARHRGRGIVGSHLVDALLARGDHVLVLDNFFTGSHRNIERHLREDAPKGRFEVIRHDVVEPFLVEIDEVY